MTPYEPPNPKSKPFKLPRLPSNARISKRPLLRPPIPSPYTSAASPKIIYISTKTPFVSAVKRVRKLLSLIEKRALGKVDLGNGRTDRERLRGIGEGGSEGQKEPEEVFLKATNRAIEKALELGVFFQGQEDVRVRLRTGSAGAVDDVVVVEERRKGGNGVRGKKKKGGQGVEGSGAGEDGEEGKEEVHQEMQKAEAEAEEEDIPETQIRKVSVLEIGISLK
ncbi:MAG: hypothetical protein Q9186_003196 [Xanthomendoza sp. 1 TL-2023]